MLLLLPSKKLGIRDIFLCKNAVLCTGDALQRAKTRTDICLMIEDCSGGRLLYIEIEREDDEI